MAIGQVVDEQEEPSWPIGLDERDRIFDAVYLVARGVRPLALVGQVAECDKQEAGELLRIAALEGQAGGLATLLPFMVWDRQLEMYSCGFTRHRWVVDLYEWLETQEPGVVPWEQRSQIMGLMLGYGADQIGHFSTKSVEVRGG